MTRVIKNSSNQSAGMGRVAALNFVNFAAEAEKIVATARAEAARTVAEARRHAEQTTSQAIIQAEEDRKEAHQQGYDKGFAEGQAKGLAEGQADGAERAFNEAMEMFREQTEQMQTALIGAIKGVDESRDDILRQAREDLLELSLTIAEKVTLVRARGDIEVAKASLVRAIEMVSSASRIQVRLCSGQIEQLREYAGQFLTDLGLSDAVQFLPDEQLQPGDVVIQTPAGEIDGRVETQIDNIIAAVTGRSKEQR